MEADLLFSVLAVWGVWAVATLALALRAHSRGLPIGSEVVAWGGGRRRTRALLLALLGPIGFVAQLTSGKRQRWARAIAALVVGVLFIACALALAWFLQRHHWRWLAEDIARWIRRSIGPWIRLVVPAIGPWAISAVVTLVLGAARSRRLSAGSEVAPSKGRRWARALLLALLGPIGVVVQLTSDKPQRRIRAFASLVVVGAVFSTSVLGVASLLRPIRWRHIRAKSAEMSEALRIGRWERPVLRGRASSFNAAEEAQKAFDELGDFPLSIYDMERAELAKLAKEHSGAFARLRASTQGAWAWTRHSVQDELVATFAATDAPSGLPAAPKSTPPMIRRQRAAYALAAFAMEGEPGECLRIATDMIRLGQDTAAGGGLLELLGGGRIIERGAALAALGGCAGRASLAERKQACGELRVLIQHGVLWGHAFALDSLFQAMAAEKIARGSSEGLANPVHAISAGLDEDEAADAAETFLRQIALWTLMDQPGYPASMTNAWGLYHQRAMSTNRLVRAGYEASVYLDQVRDTEALLRIAAVILEARVIEATTGAFPQDPPEASRAPDLCDPYTGAPFRWQRGPATLVVSSEGGVTGKPSWMKLFLTSPR